VVSKTTTTDSSILSRLSVSLESEPYMYDTYPPYLDQGLIQGVSTVSGPRYSRYSMYCISLYLNRGLIQLIQYVSDCIHTVSYM